MIRIANHKQEHLFDPWDFLSPIRRQMLKQSWVELFRKDILCELPVAEPAPFLTRTLAALQKNCTQSSVF